VSFVYLNDAAAATVLAIEGNVDGIYNSASEKTEPTVA
jgi:hypothetical protein